MTDEVMTINWLWIEAMRVALCDHDQGKWQRPHEGWVVHPVRTERLWAIEGERKWQHHCKVTGVYAQKEHSMRMHR